MEPPIEKHVFGSIGKRVRGHIKIDKETGCHLWTGCRNSFGYGLMRVGKGLARAHRMAWEAKFGPIPEGMVVMHTCDNPPCCNPEHLKLGTHGDNNRDRVKKGRGKGARTLDLIKHPQWGERPKRAAAAARARPADLGDGLALPRPVHQGADAFAAAFGLPPLFEFLDADGLHSD